MRVLRTLPVLLVVVASLAGCAASSSPSSAYVGTWGSSATGKPSLTFVSDGTLSGTDGCNTLTGTWKDSNGRAEFGPLASTMMACPDVDTWLSHATEARVDGDSLNVYGESGSQIGVLPKQ